MLELFLWVMFIIETIVIIIIAVIGHKFEDDYPVLSLFFIFIILIGLNIAALGEYGQLERKSVEINQEI